MAEKEKGAVLFDSGAVSSATFRPITNFTQSGFEKHQQRWVAVFTLTRHEKRVAAHCEDRRIESFVPLYSEKHRWKNRRTVELDLPLFPSYCFARITPQERVRVAAVPGVVSVVSAGRDPLAVPDDYIAWLQAGLLARRIRPHSGVAIGDRVTILGGPFAGMEGVLERQKNEFRVVLKLEMIGRSMSVEVGSDEIAPVGVRLECCPPPESYSYHAFSPC